MDIGRPTGGYVPERRVATAAVCSRPAGRTAGGRGAISSLALLACGSIRTVGSVAAGAIARACPVAATIA